MHLLYEMWSCDFMIIIIKSKFWQSPIPNLFVRSSPVFGIVRVPGSIKLPKLFLYSQPEEVIRGFLKKFEMCKCGNPDSAIIIPSD